MNEPTNTEPNERPAAPYRDRYRAILDNARPRFTPNEARLLCDAFNGTLFEPLGTAQQLAEDLQCIPEADRTALFEKWDVDGEHLLRKLQRLPFPAYVATVDAIERFWDDPDATVARVGLAGAPHEGDGAAPTDAPEVMQDGAENGAGNRADGAVLVRPGGQENARRAGRADLRRARERAERAAEALDAVRTAAREIESMQDAIPASMDSEHIRAMNRTLRAALRSIEADVHAASGAVQDAERERNQVLNRLDFRIPNDLPF